MDAERIRYLEQQAFVARKLTLDSVNYAGSGHLGGAMSMIELLIVLYYGTMHITPENPENPERDRLVVSKGHGAPAIYAVLSMKGYFDAERLRTLNHNGTLVPSHCDMHKVPGIDMSTGSLGQGFSVAVGMALGAEMDGRGVYVYTIVGDGECQEGQIWEAAMFAGTRKLKNLIAFIDNNKAQVDGFTDEVNSVEPLCQKWESFGWKTQTVNGHNFEELLDAVEYAKSADQGPQIIILNTFKGRGLVGLEGTDQCHHVKMNAELYAELMEGLKRSVNELPCQKVKKV